MPQKPAATVLVVDDEPDLREAVSAVLELLGYRVECAADGLEALRVLDRKMPSLILLDMKMPGLDGWGFARRAREKLGSRLPPIVVLTAADNPAQRAAEIGAQGFVGKPFEIDALRDEIGRLAAPHA